MALQVLGVGLPRTGTNSFKLAMEILGFGKCHHMYEVLENPGQARGFVAAARGEPVDWDGIYTGYHSCCDFPSCYFWRELAAYYPEAKVVLTFRDAGSWYKSMCETIFAVYRESSQAVDDPVVEMGREIFYQRMFGGDIEDEQHVLDVYRRHNHAIIDSIPAHRLLVFDAREGWEPLCAFRGIPVPDEPYPHANAPEEFKQKTQGFIEQTRG